jgi:outer membrane protein assembly factor BamB
MVAVGDLLYMVADNGVMSCVEAKSGEVVWEERACGPISASLLHAGGKIYLQDEAGLGVVVKAGRMFQIISKNDLKERSLASVSVCDQHLIIRTLEHLYRIGTP